MGTVYEEIEKKYIVKKDIEPVNKMKRNLQPEVEKVKSINKSLMELGYISDDEKRRLKSELVGLLNNLEYY